MNGVGRGMINHGVTEEDNTDGDMWKNQFQVKENNSTVDSSWINERMKFKVHLP